MPQLSSLSTASTVVFLLAAALGVISIMFLYYLCDRWRNQRGGERLRRGSRETHSNANSPSYPLVDIKITVEDSDTGVQKTVTSISELGGNKRKAKLDSDSPFFKNIREDATISMVDEEILDTKRDESEFCSNNNCSTDYYPNKSCIIDLENNCISEVDRSATVSAEMPPANGTLVVCDIIVDEYISEKVDATVGKNQDISDTKDDDSGIAGLNTETSFAEVEIEVEHAEKQDEILPSSSDKENISSEEKIVENDTIPTIERPNKLSCPERNTKPRKSMKKLKVNVSASNSSTDLHSPTSSSPRPFKLIVKDETFVIDSEYMKGISPIFSTMFYGKDFEKDRELMRVIVDETPDDIRTLLDVIKTTKSISVKNFGLLLRLSKKYQIPSIQENCEQFARNQDLEKMTGEDVLTLLVDAYEFACARDVVTRLIIRLSKEGNAAFARLKISRYLNAQIYGAVISSSMNFSTIREMETMNGHQLAMSGSHTKWEFGYCSICNMMKSESCNCTGCYVSMCRMHLKITPCEKQCGLKRIEQLKEEIASPPWNY